MDANLLEVHFAHGTYLRALTKALIASGALDPAQLKAQLTVEGNLLTPETKIVFDNLVEFAEP